jgi:hypothetical protein
MAHEEHENLQPLRELEWLAQYFKKHCREDLAGAIFQQVKQLRHRAQDSLTDDASDVIDFNKNTKRKSSE